MSCLTAVLNLIKSWWYVDRIRVPRATGSLLQLRTGERLLIGDEVFIVRKKTLVSGPRPDKNEAAACTGVRYTLAVYHPTHLSTRLSDSPEDQSSMEAGYTLEVELGDEISRPPRMQFVRNGQVEQLFDDDVTLLAAS